MPAVPPPPPARVDDVVDVLHGVEVPDPYRWLEDGESPEVRAWVDAQNDRTRAVLDALPHRAPLHARLTQLLQVGVATAPTVAGGRLFSLDRAGGADQAVLVVRSATDATAPARVVLDPLALTGESTSAIDWYHPAPDGRLVAYGTSEGGSERSTLAIVDVDTGQHLPDSIPETRAASVAWLPDGSAFAYTRYPPESEHGRRIYWHAVGSAWEDDELLFEEGADDPTSWADVGISPDGRWLVAHVEHGWSRTDVFVRDRTAPDPGWTTVIAGEEAVTWAQVVDDVVYAVTNLDAPRGRVVRASATTPAVADWTTIVPEGEAVLEGLTVAGPSLLVAAGLHASARLFRCGRDGSSLVDVPLPEVGSLAGLDAEPADPDGAAFLSFTSFTRPPALWRLTPDDALTPWSAFPSDEGVLDADRFEVEQVRYPSTDGTLVPMFLVKGRDTVLGPDTPTVLSGYGGFAVSSSPAWSPGIVAACESGMAYAIACIRGGAEYGEDWHRAGMLGNKQQVFDDFAAAADWLVAEHRTTNERLAIRGGSNGGLLVGATITERPDLCRAAVCAVPLLDMVRYSKFLIGALWIPEYGDPEDPTAFGWLHAYSPYHHVVDGTEYPATLLLTAESDSRVHPLHALKFAARLQAAAASQDERPVLLRVETKAGHGVGKPVTKQADELADTWAFVLWQLGAEVR